MPISINSNHASVIAKTQLNNAIETRNNSLEKLITGSRINSSKDDAAGVAISQNLDVKVKGLQQAKMNVQLGLSYTELANKSIKIMQANVQRLRDLAERASNDIVINTDRQSMQTEVDLILSELLRTKESTEFNGIKVFGNTDTPQGSQPTNINIQVGIDNSHSSIINIETGFDFDSTDVDLSTAENSKSSLDTVDGMATTLSEKDSDIASTSNRLNTALDSLLSQVTTLSSAKSMILDADIATEAVSYVKSQILTSFGSHLLNVANDNSKNTYQLVSGGLDKTSIATSKQPNVSSAVSTQSTLSAGEISSPIQTTPTTPSIGVNNVSAAPVGKTVSTEVTKLEIGSTSSVTQQIGNSGNSSLNLSNSVDSSKTLTSSSLK